MYPCRVWPASSREETCVREMEGCELKRDTRFVPVYPRAPIKATRFGVAVEDVGDTCAKDPVEVAKDREEVEGVEEVRAGRRAEVEKVLRAEAIEGDLLGIVPFELEV